MKQKWKSDMVKKFLSPIAGLMCAVALLVPTQGRAQEASPAQANAIEAVTASQQGSLTILRFQLKKPLKDVPGDGFTQATPARIVLDFPDTGNALGKTVVDVSQGELRTVNVVESGNRTRVVFNLKRMVPFQKSVQGNVLTVTLGGDLPGTTASGAAPTQFVAPKDAAARHAVRDIDFRLGKTGEGRIVVDLSDADTGVDIRTQGQNIVLEFLKTSLPASLRRKLDVGDFGTPVRVINTFQQGDNVRMVIEPTGLWEHNAYQSDNRFVLEVKAIKEDPNKLVQGTRQGYKGEKLSLNFQNVEVRALLQVIADFTNLNIIASETVGGNITLRLKDVPWDQALDIIMQAKGLDMRKRGNVLWIAPRDELTTKEKLEFEAKLQVAELEPLRTESFQLNYQKAENFKKILTDEKQRILSKRGSAVLDPRTNQLFIQDIPSKLEEIRNLIAKVDVAARQVLIEARIVEADDKFSKNLGAKLGFTDLAQNSTTAGWGAGTRTRAAVTGNYLGVGEQTGQATVTDQSYIPNTQFVSLPAGSINGATPGSFAISLFKQGALKFLNLEISALEADGRGKIISSPRVVTADNVEALIEQGEEIPYQQATSSGATSISFKKAVLSLKVKPQITPEGNVVLTVEVNKDSRGELAGGIPAINTKKVQTEVMVENGGTVVIGGIYQQTERDQVTKVPLLGDIPVFGNLFKNKSKQDDKTELLIFLTPKVLNDKLTGTQQ